MPRRAVTLRRVFPNLDDLSHAERVPPGAGLPDPPRPGGPAIRLTPPQQAVADGGYLTAGFSCLLSMPTGAGKTFLMESEVFTPVLASGHRAIYLTPTRALASELTARWQARFPAHRVGIFTGDYGRPGGAAYPVPFAEADLYVFTPERLDAVTRWWREHWAWLPQVDVIVVDEAHLLGDRTRGGRLEGALLRFRQLQPLVRLVLLSATVSNRGDLARWIGGVTYHSTWRPVPLTWRTVAFRRAEHKQMLLLETLQRNVRAGGKSLVFVLSRRRAETLAAFLQEQGLQAAYHHSGLSAARREQVEQALRSRDLDVLTCTPTLEVGLNLPVRQVCLYDVDQWDGRGFSPISVISAWQRVGRAGRPGLDPEGEAVVFVPAWDRGAVPDYARGEFEPIRSGLRERRALAEQVVATIGSGYCRTLAQTEAFFRSSLAHQQGLLPPVASVVADMVAAGMLSEVPDERGREPRLRATRFGRIVVRHLVDPATVLLFRAVLSSVPFLSFLDLLLLVSAAGECEPVLPVEQQELPDLSAALSGEPSYLLQMPADALCTLLGATRKRLLSAIKMALVLRAWTRTGDADLVAEDLRCYAPEVDRLVESAERLLLALAAVPEHPDAETPPPVGEVPLWEQAQALQHMVSAGLDETCVSLSFVGGIGSVWARRLVAAGVTDVEELALADPGALAALDGLSLDRATRWVTEAAEIVKERSAVRYQESGPLLPLLPLPPSWPASIDAFRLRRALSLTVQPADAPGVYSVSGGAAPHQVRQSAEGLACDCEDAARGHRCKHVLAVQIAQGEPAVLALCDQLPHTDPTPSPPTSLFSLYSA